MDAEPVAMLLPLPLQNVWQHTNQASIIPRGIGALGCRMHWQTEDRHQMRCPARERWIAMWLGGGAGPARFLRLPLATPARMAGVLAALAVSLRLR